MQSFCLTVARYAPDLDQALASNEMKSQGPLILGHEESAFDHGYEQLTVDNMSNGCNSIPHHYDEVPTTEDHLPSHNARFGRRSYGLPPNQYNFFGSLSPIFLGCASNTAGVQQLMQQAPRPQLGVMHHHPRNPTRIGLRQTSEYGGGHHNIVDTDRIRKGLDVRTTVIPTPNFLCDVWC